MILTQTTTISFLLPQEAQECIRFRNHINTKEWTVHGSSGYLSFTKMDMREMDKVGEIDHV